MKGKFRFAAGIGSSDVADLLLGKQGPICLLTSTNHVFSSPCSSFRTPLRTFASFALKELEFS
jgi:hypothetical protein